MHHWDAQYILNRLPMKNSSVSRTHSCILWRFSQRPPPPPAPQGELRRVHFCLVVFLLKLVLWCKGNKKLLVSDLPDDTTKFQNLLSSPTMTWHHSESTPKPGERLPHLCEKAQYFIISGTHPWQNDTATLHFCFSFITMPFKATPQPCGSRVLFLTPLFFSHCDTYLLIPLPYLMYCQQVGFLASLC